MPDMAISNGAASTPTAEPAPTADTPVVSSPKNPTLIFWELADLCYELYRALGAVTQFLNDALNKSVLELRALSGAQLLANESGPAPSADPPKADKNFPFGGGTADGAPDPDGLNPIALKRANDLLAILHKYGLATNIPADYLKNNGAVLTEESRRKIIVGDFTTLQSNLTTLVDRLKNSTGVETTKAEGALKSGSAAIDLCTGIVKSQNTMGQAVVTGLRM